MREQGDGKCLLFQPGVDVLTDLVQMRAALDRPVPETSFQVRDDKGAATQLLENLFSGVESHGCHCCDCSVAG